MKDLQTKLRSSSLRYGRISNIPPEVSAASVSESGSATTRLPVGLRLYDMVLPLLLDLVYFLLFVIVSGLAVPFPSLRRDVLHAFTRNFWGKLRPQLDGRPVVWMHAVSAGEALVCRRILDCLRLQRPDLQFVLSIGTSDGREITRMQMSDLPVFYAPFDFSWAVRRTFEAIQPSALLIAENDFWPNMLREASRRNVPIAIFNTRMSRREQSEHYWNAWLLRPGLTKTGWWGASTDRDAEWIRHFFHVRSPQLEVTGSLKFDGTLRHSSNPQTDFYRIRFGFHGQEKILVAGSTHSPEETWLIGVFKKLTIEFPLLRLILAPRNVFRSDDIERTLQREGVEYLRTSRMPERCQKSTQVTFVDSMGALRDLWGLADFAFVGGSLASHGGQNFVEPASYGKPVCIGPHIWNFQSVADEFLAANAIIQIQTIDDLEKTLRNWLTHPEQAERLGFRAREVVQKQTQAIDCTVSGILSVLPPLAVSMKGIS